MAEERERRLEVIDERRSCIAEEQWRVHVIE